MKRFLYKRSRVILKKDNINYKNILLLRKFISPNGKILPRRLTKITAKQQRQLCKCIKNARLVGFIPFIRISSF